MSNTTKTLFSVFLSLILILFSVQFQTVSASSKNSISFVLLSKYSADLSIGDKFSILAFTSSGKSPTWKSSNTSVASVNTSGKVTAKKAGTVTITAKIKNAEAYCKVTVNKTKISLNIVSASMEHGEKLKLIATTSNNSVVTWKSSKKSIATVDQNGNVTGMKPGESIITATADKSSVTCKIRVKLPVITFDKTSITLFRGQKAHLSAVVSSGITPTWKSNKKSIAVVDKNGNVTAVKNGSATITATVDGVTKSCEVVVQKPQITLSASGINLKKGTSTIISASVSSGNPPVWSSSNPNIATVDSTGKVNAVKKGTAYVYASEDGMKTRCTVHVTE